DAMRRTATAALTAALMLTGTSAALAQPGPPSDIPAPPAQAQGSPATGEDRSAEARENAAPQGSPATGQERSAEARAHASERSGVTVPASEEAREGGRDFGEQRAAAARARGEQENDATENAVDGDDLEVDGLDDVDLPEQGDEARGVLTTITESVTSLLNTIKSLFGF
ncbi:MAG: hypothetical protein WD250_09920, partial [Egibacteraceae bacterium]